MVRASMSKLFAIAIAVLALAFAVVLRLAGGHSAASIAALMAIEVLAIGVALGFHLVELPRRSRANGGMSAKRER